MRLITFYMLFFNLFSITSFKIVKNRLKKSTLIWLTSLIFSHLFFNLLSVYFSTGNENYEERFQKYFNDQGSSLLLQMFMLKNWIDLFLGLVAVQYMNFFRYKQLLKLLNVCKRIHFFINFDIDKLKDRLRKKIKLFFVATFISRAAEFFSYDRYNTLTLFWALTSNFTSALRVSAIVLMLSSFIEFFRIFAEKCIFEIKANKLNATVIQNFIILESNIFELFNETLSKAYKTTIVYIAIVLTLRVSMLYDKTTNTFLMSSFIHRFITCQLFFDTMTQLATSFS